MAQQSPLQRRIDADQVTRVELDDGSVVEARIRIPPPVWPGGGYFLFIGSPTRQLRELVEPMSPETTRLAPGDEIELVVRGATVVVSRSRASQADEASDVVLAIAADEDDGGVSTASPPPDRPAPQAT